MDVSHEIRLFAITIFVPLNNQSPRLLMFTERSLCTMCQWLLNPKYRLPHLILKANQRESGTIDNSALQRWTKPHREVKSSAKLTCFLSEELRTTQVHPQGPHASITCVSPQTFTFLSIKVSGARVVQGEMDHNELSQRPESWRSQTGSSSKPYFSIIGSRRAVDSLSQVPNWT